MTNTNMEIFKNEEFGSVRVVVIDNDPWFVGRDVAAALGYANTKDALGKHIDAEDKKIIQRSSGATFNIPPRGLTVINESGLYSLMLSCRLASGKRFKRWITAEVLPTIRKNGFYITDPLLQQFARDPDFAHAVVDALYEQSERVNELVPKAYYFDAFVSPRGRRTYPHRRKAARRVRTLARAAARQLPDTLPLRRAARAVCGQALPRDVCGQGAPHTGDAYGQAGAA